MTPDDPLRALRADMDALNDRMLAALHERARLARRIGRLKRDTGAAAVDPAREQAMLAAALAAAPADGFPAPALTAILGAVFAASRELVRAPDR
ncbi:MAG: chorismate mutase [Planctomycetes bacterium]|nr:chorismate mutase [Planctomycetota bacterium]